MSKYYHIEQGPSSKKPKSGTGLRGNVARLAKPPLEDDSFNSVLRSMRETAEKLSGLGKKKDANEIYAQMGDMYYDKRLFHLAGTYYRKAGKMEYAGVAFFNCLDYPSAARCFEIAKRKDMAKKAYARGGTKAEKEGDLPLAQHLFRKAGKNARAAAIDKKRLARRQFNESMRKKSALKRVPRRRVPEMGDFEFFLHTGGVDRSKTR